MAQQERSLGLHAHIGHTVGASCLRGIHPLSLSELLGSLQAEQEEKKDVLLEGWISSGSFR